MRKAKKKTGSRKETPANEGKPEPSLKRAPRSGVRPGGEKREDLRRKSSTVAVALSGSGKAGRVDAEGAVCRNVAILSGHVAFDSRLFRRQIPRRPREHAGRDHRRNHLRRKSARCNSGRTSSTRFS